VAGSRRGSAGPPGGRRGAGGCSGVCSTAAGELGSGAPVRVLLVNDYSTPGGGAEGQAVALRAGLRARGHEVRLLSSDAGWVPGAPLADATCRGSTSGRAMVALQTANPFARRLLHRELRDFRPDVVHVRMFLTQLSPLLLPLLRGVPSVYHVAFYEAVCPKGTKLLPDGSLCEVRWGRVCRRAGCVPPVTWAAKMVQLTGVDRWRGAFDRYLALSATVARRLEADGFGPVEVLPNGVTDRRPRPPLTGSPTVLFAGRLVREKGADVLVDALAALPGVRAVIAGDGPELEPLRALAARRGLADRVELPGRLDRAELERRADRAWVQVVPGRWEEPFGNVATEAMARGTAVVASALGGPAETVRDGVTGALVPPGDAAALADALRPLLADRAVAERLGAAGREVARAEYTHDRVLDRVETVHREMVAAHAAGGRTA
jgi:glycosyltransferase involved in cell wall biosynthesis